MNFINIHAQDETLVNTLSTFATEIIREHYEPILGKKQNDYMLEMFQSPQALLGQIQSGYQYYLVRDKLLNIGFMAFYPRDGKMYLSKFYIHKTCRKKGYSSKMFSFVIRCTVEAGLESIFLNVNKYNEDSIAVYKHLGFIKIGKEKNDIGNGYFMDDFIMAYSL